MPIDTRPPLILLHGALGSKAQLQSLASQLNTHFETHTLNFGGHGGLPIPDTGMSMPVFARDVLLYMQEHELAQADFFGYSMGGYVALYLARKHPDKVGRIFTLGTKFDWTADSAAREVRQLDPEVISEKVPQFADQLRQRHHPQDWTSVLESTAYMMSALGSGLGLSEADFQAITQQVRITRGSLDKMVSEAESQTVAEAIPHGSFENLEGIKHPIESIDAQAMASLILDFLN